MTESTAVIISIVLGAISFFVTLIWVKKKIIDKQIPKYFLLIGLMALFVILLGIVLFVVWEVNVYSLSIVAVFAGFYMGFTTTTWSHKVWKKRTNGGQKNIEL